jgi:DNA-directed RNA polymerase specialized sigma24 family protein
MRKQAAEAKTFEQVLLSHAELCYSVALALTRDPYRAQDLARHALTWAWHLRDSADGKENIKKRLLEVLRERFLLCYSQVPESPKPEYAIRI